MNIKNIILVIAIVIVVIGTFFFLMSHQAHPKLDSRIVMLSENNLTEGDNFTVQLTDLNGTPLANERLNVTIIASSSGSRQEFMVTNESGEVSFELDNNTIGSCAVKVSFGGNDEYNGCSWSDSITINQKVIPVITTNSTEILGNGSDYGYYYGSNYTDGEIVTVEY